MIEDVPSTAKRRRRTPTPLRVINRPARFPEHGLWPFEMRADMAAAFLDFGTTRELMAGIVEGDAPKATAIRGEGRSREPVWHVDSLKEFLAKRHGTSIDDKPGGRLRDVIAGHAAFSKKGAR